MFLLVPAHPGFPGQIPQSRKTVVCVCVGPNFQSTLMYNHSVTGAILQGKVVTF